MHGNDNALVVMYHYILDNRESAPAGIRPLFTDEFEQQLDWLEENFQIVAPEEFLFAVKNGMKSAAKAPCLLTFDDGTRDHWEVVAPVLRRRSLRGIFFVLAWPTQRRKMPVTHALHWLLGQPEEEVWRGLRSFAEENLGGTDALGSSGEAMRVYHYETGLRGLIKYAVNFALPPEAAEEVITSLAQAHGQALDQLAAQWFLGEREIKLLSDSGMEIGMHGSSHRSLTQLGGKGMAEEVVHSSAYLHSLTGKAPTWFCWPFGDSDLDKGTEIVQQACRRLGVEAVVTTEKSFATSKTDPYKIPRYDCIYLPPRSNELSAQSGQSP